MFRSLGSTDLRSKIEQDMHVGNLPAGGVCTRCKRERCPCITRKGLSVWPSSVADGQFAAVKRLQAEPLGDVEPDTETIRYSR